MVTLNGEQSNFSAVFQVSFEGFSWNSIPHTQFSQLFMLFT